MEDCEIIFDDKRRFSGKVILDADKIKELAEFYKELHKNEG